ncbi:hypothetical protein KSS87_017553 [Heliosperma pusillum]|nr:hypothetical protein KSS87_017553 [Heliosperma pusillum]
MNQGNQWHTVTLKIWHGGNFKRVEKRVVYMSRSFRTVGIDPDELCWFTLVEEAEKYGGFNRNVDAIFFMNLNVGL